MGFSTDAIHIAQEPDETTGAIMPPIYLASTYAYENIDKSKQYIYSRSANPTRCALEKNIAALEKAKHAFAFSTGMAALSTLMLLFKPGDHSIVSKDLYGGSFRLFEYVMKNMEMRFSYVDTADAENIARAITPQTHMVFIETPSNPLLKITDIAAVAEICNQHNLISVIDNTFMTPYFQNPLTLGIDIVLHSTTKYINGHSDCLGGILATNDAAIAEKLQFLQKSAGAVLSPFDSWLTMRGVKTLALRMDKHNANARIAAEFLRNQPDILKVYYPGFEDFPGYEIMKKQSRGFGGIVSFDMGTYEKARTFLSKLKMCALAESLGGIETLICLPATMTHSSVPPEIQQEMGITRSLIRISVGCEDPADIIDDLNRGSSL